MRTYNCPYCRCKFSEADKAWDVAIESGQCPECLEPLRKFSVHTKQETLPPLRNFPLRSKQQEGTPPVQQPQLQEERPATQQPYPWGSVLTWMLFAFLLGFTTARPTWKSATSIDRSALGVLVGIVYALLTGAIVGSWKYYKRTSSQLLGATQRPWDGASAIKCATGWRFWVFIALIALIVRFLGLLGGLVFWGQRGGPG